MDKIQIIATTGSIMLILFIVSLIRNRRLKEEYSLMWILISFVFLGLSLWKGGLDWVALQLGISYPPAALFLILIMAVFVMLIEMSLIISKQSEWIKQSAQDIGMMKLDIDNLLEANGKLKNSIQIIAKKQKVISKVEGIKENKVIKLKVKKIKKDREANN